MMKVLYSLLYILAVSLMLCACSESDTQPYTEPIARYDTLRSVSLTDKGFDKEDGTKAFAHTFHKGEQAGLFIVKDGQPLEGYANLPLTAILQDDGLTWQAPSGTSIPSIPGASYYLYAPYQPQSKAMPDYSAHPATDFFRPLLSQWTTASHQNDTASYVASDLMIASGTVETKSINFDMNHAMKLITFTLPSTRWQLSTDAAYTWKEPQYSQPIFDRFTPFKTDPGSYRLLVSPSQESLSGSYIAADGKEQTWQIDLKSIATGTCTEAVHGVTEKRIHTLRQGDYFMDNGGLKSQLSSEDVPHCIGVVYWTENPSKDDAALRREHPTCTHGLVVSVDGDMPGPWQENAGKLNYSVGTWIEHPSNGISQLYQSVTTDNGPEDNLNKIVGYNNTRAMERYNQQNPDFTVEIVQKCVDYRESTSHRAPAMTSDWFVPSEKELTLLSGKDIYDIWTNESSVLIGTETRDLVNERLKAVSGSLPLQELRYWSSSERSPGVVYYVYFTYGGAHSSSKFYATYRVRFVLAF